MAQQLVNVGAAPNDDTGDPFRTAFIKLNENFTEVYTILTGVSTSDLQFSGNSIVATNTNGDIILDPNGTGSVQVEGGAQFTIDNTTPSTTAITGADDLIIGNGAGNRGITMSVGAANSGAVYITDTDGALHGGFDYSESTDTLSFYTSGIAQLTVDGTGILSTGRIQLDENIISTTDSNENLVLDPSGTGVVQILSDLVVEGTTTTIDSITVTLEDPILTIGGDTPPISDDNKDRGIEFNWHNGSTAKVGFFGFDDSTGRFTFIADGTNTSEVFSGTPGDVEFGTVYGTFAGSGSTFDFITLSGNTVSTNASNANLELDPSGTGTIEALATINVTGDVTATNISAVDFTATGDITNNRITITENVISTGTSNENIVLTPSGTGVVEISGDLSIIGDIVDPISNGRLLITENVISTIDSNEDIVLDPVAAGNVVIFSGNLELNADPSTDDHVGDRGYNDLRYALQTTTITGTGGLANGGDLTTSRTITLDITGQSDVAIASADEIVFADNDDGNNPKKRTMGDIITDLDIATNAGLVGVYLPLSGGGTVTGAVDIDFITIDGNIITTNATNADLELDASGSGNVLMTVPSVGINNLDPTAFTNGATSLVIGDGATPEGITLYTGIGDTGSFYFADGTSGSDDIRGGLTYNHSTETLILSANATDAITITDTDTILGGNLTVTGNITNNDDTSTLIITGATTTGGGPQLSFVGPSAGGTPNTMRFLANGSERLSFGVGFISVKDEIFQIAKISDTGSLLISGGSTGVLGGNIILHAETHALRPGRTVILDSTTPVANFGSDTIIFNEKLEFVNSSINSLVTNEDLILDAQGTGGVTVTPDFTMSALMHVSVTNTITAGSTQTQAGATALTTTWNRISTGATNDGVALPAAAVGRLCYIRNDTGNAIQVWPNNGQDDTINDGAADAVDADTIANNATRLYVAATTNDWYSMVL